MRKSDLETVLATADLFGDGAAVFDESDRLVFANRFHRAIHPFIDFDRPQSFETCFWSSIEHGAFAGAEIYRRPEAWLAVTNERRREHPDLQFHRRRSDGRCFLIRIRRVPGVGSVQLRTELTEGIDDIVDFVDPRFGTPDAAPGKADAASDPAVQQELLARLIDILDSIPVPAAAVSAFGMVRWMSRSMADLLDRDDGLRFEEGRIRATDGQADLRLRRMMLRYGFMAGREAHTLVRVPRRQGAGCSLVRVSAVRSAGTGFSPTAVVTVGDPQAVGRISPKLLARVYGLSPDEADLVLRVAAGGEAEAVAGDDARARLARVIERLGCADRLGLVRLLTHIANLAGSR